MPSPVWSDRSPVQSPLREESREDYDGYFTYADVEGQEKRLLSTSASSSISGMNSGRSTPRRRMTRRDSYSLRYVSKWKVVIAVIAAGAFVLALCVITSQSLPHLLKSTPVAPGAHKSLTKLHHSTEHVEGIWPEDQDLGEGGTTALCDICDCETQPNIWAPKAKASRYVPRPSKDDIFPAPDSVNLDEYMREAVLDIFCSRQHMSTSQTSRLVRRTAEHLEKMISWNVTGLDFEKPTIYLTTNTSPNGKAGPLRPQFFRRHARSILDWQGAANATNWQVLWLIVEDELDTDPEVIRSLRRIGVPYVYYAYGPTNGLGHAQRNAAMQLIWTLTQRQERGGLFGHGPVYCLDDDNKMEPELLTMMTSLQRIGVFPVGNFGVEGGYEIPLVSPIGEVMGSNSPWPNRTYPFDNAGFAFNSSLLGTKISGPTFWKWNEYGGESQFIGQIVSDVRQIEPLCGPTKEQNCHWAWHNEPLTKLQQLTDEEEDEFWEKKGVDEWRSQLEGQLQQRRDQRGY